MNKIDYMVSIFSDLRNNAETEREKHLAKEGLKLFIDIMDEEQGVLMEAAETARCCAKEAAAPVKGKPGDKRLAEKYAEKADELFLMALDRRRFCGNVKLDDL